MDACRPRNFVSIAIEWFEWWFEWVGCIHTRQQQAKYIGTV